MVVGLKDKKLSEQLQLDFKLTLEKAVTKARQSETVKKQQTFLQGHKSELQPANVDCISKGKGKDLHIKGKDQKKSPKPKHASDETAEAKRPRCLGLPHAKRLVQQEIQSAIRVLKWISGQNLANLAQTREWLK